MLNIIWNFLFIQDKINCTDPPLIEGGVFNIEEYSLGSTIVLKCQEMYYLRGGDYYTCELNGNWQGNGSCSKLNYFLNHCTF